MAFEFKTNFFDVVKAIGVAACVYFLIVQVPSMFNKHVDSKNIDKTVIEQIAKNVSRAVVEENDSEVDTLVEELRAQNSVAIKSIKELGDKVSGIGIIVGSIEQSVEKEVIGDYYDDTEGSRDLHTFLVNSSLESKDGSKMPIATVYYSPEIEDINDRVATDAHKIEFRTNIIEAISVDDKPTRTVEAWAENNWTSESKGKKYPIDLYIDKWAIKKPPKSFMWNPRLGIAMFASIDDMFPGIDISLWSYGNTKRDVDFRFMDVFLGGTDEDFIVGLIPVSYNIGNKVPLVSNMFVGAFVGSDFEDVNYGLSISVPF